MRRRRRKRNISSRIFPWGNLYTKIGAFIESTSYTQRVLKESVPPIFQSIEAFQTTMVGSKKMRDKAAAMAKSTTAQSHSTHNPAIDMVAPPPLTTSHHHTGRRRRRTWWNLSSRWACYNHRLRPGLGATSSVPSIASTLDVRFCVHLQ
ncbi:unnamed protein product [Prunus armeniaca]